MIFTKGKQRDLIISSHQDLTTAVNNWNIWDYALRTWDGFYFSFCLESISIILKQHVLAFPSAKSHITGSDLNQVCSGNLQVYTFQKQRDFVSQWIKGVGGES